MTGFGKLAAAALVGAVTLGQGSVASAQDYPTETVRIVVPWGAGGGTDTIARAFAAELEALVDEAVIVQNIAGAAGATGSFQVSQAKADGYTVLLNGSSDFTSPMVFQDLPFGVDDFKYVGGFFVTPTWMVSHKDRGYESFDQFVEAAKAQPDTLTLGVGGATGAHAMMAHAVRGYLDLPVRIINYQGGAALNKAILANEVDAGVIHAPVLLNEVREDMVNVLIAGGSLSGITHEPVRGTPTLEGTDIPISIGVTRGLMVPADTPDEVVARLSELAMQATESAGFAAFGDKFGFAPTWLGPEQFEAVVRGEIETFQDLKTRFFQ